MKSSIVVGSDSTGLAETRELNRVPRKAALVLCRNRTPHYSSRICRPWSGWIGRAL